MTKSAGRNRAEGGLDKMVGRMMEGFSKLTGNKSGGAKGKATRARGAARSTKGRAKRTARR